LAKRLSRDNLEISSEDEIFLFPFHFHDVFWLVINYKKGIEQSHNKRGGGDFLHPLGTISITNVQEKSTKTSRHYLMDTVIKHPDISPRPYCLE